MSTDGQISGHWSHGGVAEAILTALEKAGVDGDNLTAKDLHPLDQMHGRGVVATREMMARLAPTPGWHLLDIGSGIGGPARLAALEYGCRVTGIDLTREFCDVAAMLTERTGLADLVRFQQGDALALPFDDQSFDAAYTHNVTMNIADKETFYREAFRVVKPGGVFYTAGLAEGPAGPPFFPVPWAKVPEDSHLVSPEETERVLEDSGFEIVEFIDQTDVMLAYYEQARQRIAAEGPPVLGVHVILGEDGKDRLKNSSRSVEEKRVVPIEVVCRRL